MRALILTVLLAAPAVFASDCYISHCRVDKDGTRWCYNEPVECDSLKNLQCTDNQCDVPEGTELTYNCSADSDDGEPIDVVIAPHYEKRPYDGPRGGIGLDGADGSLWEHSGVYSGIRSDSSAFYDWPDGLDGGW